MTGANMPARILSPPDIGCFTSWVCDTLREDFNTRLVLYFCGLCFDTDVELIDDTEVVSDDDDVMSSSFVAPCYLSVR